MQIDSHRIVNALLRKIANAEYAPGDPIPTVVQLAAEHDVPVSAAHDARSRLIADGVLALRPGVGTVVATPSVGQGNDTDEQLVVARDRLEKDIAFLRDALENPDTSVRWDPDALPD